MEEETRPWESEGYIRRDAEPHRAKLLASLASISHTAAWFSVFGFLCVPLAIVALPLGAAVWWIANRDLARMDSGDMDPSGQQGTAVARHQGRQAVGIGAAVLAVWIVLVVGLWYMALL